MKLSPYGWDSTTSSYETRRFGFTSEAALIYDQASINYTQEDFTKNGQTYDVIFDAVGKSSFRRCRRSLKPGGIYLETDLGFLWHVPLLALLTRRIGDKRVKLGITQYSKKDVLFLKELIEAGKYRAVIDRRYSLEQVVEATKYVETGQKAGNVVLTINGERGS
jgi:NADPH:quinone reductase-like Zn-dependent oxidoreductase